MVQFVSTDKPVNTHSDEAAAQMARSNVVEPAATRKQPKFKPRPGDMYGARNLSDKALKAIRVLAKCSVRLQEIMYNVEETDNVFQFHYTITQAVKALDYGTGYGINETRAFLPPVIRHLMVQVYRNLKDPIPVVQNFINDERLMAMLDKEWSTPLGTAVISAAKVKSTGKPRVRATTH